MVQNIKLSFKIISIIKKQGAIRELYPVFNENLKYLKHSSYVEFCPIIS